MSRFTPRSSETIAATMLAAVRARTRISDFRANGPTAQIVGTFADQLAAAELRMAYLEALFSLDNQRGEVLTDRGAAVLPENQQRGEGAHASGYLVFGRTGTVGAVAIPQGARGMTTANGRPVYYATTAAGTILHGNAESAWIPALCVEAGTIGNCADGAVNQMGSSVPGASYVRNPTSFANGTDVQEDKDYRDAIRAHVRGLGRTNEDGVLAAVRQATSGAKSVKHAIVWDVPGVLDYTDVVLDDGFGTADDYGTYAGGVVLAAAVGGEQFVQLPHWPCRTLPTITVLPAPLPDAVVLGPWGRLYFPTPLAAGDSVSVNAYTYYQGLVAEAQRCIDGDPTNRDAYPSVRVLGSLLRARPATVQWLTINGTVVAADGYAPDAVVDDVRAAIVAAVNRGTIGAPSYLAQRIAAAMTAPGAENVTLDGTDVYAASDVVIRTAPALVTLTWGA